MLEYEDYLSLWIYFQDRATSVKGAMFNTITWIIGFAAALLGFIFANLTNFDSSKAAISLSMLMRLASGAGLAICLYAFLALTESAKHIKNNWKYADECLNEIQEVKGIVKNNRNAENQKDKIIIRMKIWNELRIVVSLFFTAFISIFVWSFTIQKSCS